MRLTTLLVLLFICCSAFAQEPAKSELARCGTPPGISPWLRDYSSRPQDFAVDRSSDTLYVGLQVHLLAKDNGVGRFAPARLLDAFCRLNADFAPARVRFYFKNDWNEIDSTAWYQHPDIVQGIEMMLANNVPGALNTYFAANVAGNCGYNLPYAGVAMAHNCSGPNDHVWAHEVGHALSLQHTFLGWDGKVYNAQNPTPDTLTYDYTYFHDTLDTQIPAPLDTALVEYVDGSNCTVAADLFCDTKPDYLSYGWDCDGQGYSLVQQKDPAGAVFYSDGTLFMSYANDACQNRFSDEQIAALRANLLTEKSGWLAAGPPQGDIIETPELLSPTDGQLVPADGTVLEWSAVPNATKYIVQVSRFSNFFVKEIETVTTGTSLATGPMINNLTFYWRVRPFNDWFACTNLTPSASFKTADLSSAIQPGTEEWRCYPTLLAPGQPLFLEIPGHRFNQLTRCTVYDAAGRAMWVNEDFPDAATIQIDLPSVSWPAGIYRIVLVQEKGVNSLPVLLIR